MPTAGETKRLQAILEANPVPTVITRMCDGLVKYANASIAELVRLPIDNIVNRKTPDFFHHPEEWESIMRELAKKGALKGQEIHCRKAEGTPFWALVSFTAMDFEGEPSVMTLFYDITEQKQAMAALQTSEKKFRVLIEHCNDAIFIADVESGAIAEVNRKAEELIGLPRESLIGMHQSRLHPPEDVETYRGRFRTRVVSGKVVNDDIIVQHSDGHKIPVNVSASRIEIDGKALILGVFRDITKSKQAEDALRSREAQLSVIHEHIRDIVFVIGVEPNDHFRFLSMNHRGLEARGLAEAEIVGKLVQEVIPQASHALVIGKYKEAIRSGKPVHWDEVSDYPTGRKVGEVTVSPVFDENGRCSQLVGTIHDITDRNRVKDHLRRVNRTLRMISDCNQALVHISNEAQLLKTICTLMVNEGGYRMAWVGKAEHDDERHIIPLAQAGFEDGYLEVAHISWADNKFGGGPSGRAIRTGKCVVCQDVLQDPAFLPWRDQAVRHGYAATIAFPLAIDGKVTGTLNIYASEPNAFHAEEIQILGELAGDLAFGMEVLRHKKEKESLEQQLRQAQKMEAVGMLAGGIAHDFNNMLAGMLGQLYLIKLEVTEGRVDTAKAVERLDAVDAEGRKAAAVINQLMTFARKGEVRMQQVELNRLVSDAMRLHRVSIPENIGMDTHLEQVDLSVNGEAGMIQQMLLNLLTNARDALADQAGPHIDVALSRFVPDTAFIEAHAGFEACPYARLTVRDNGSGMDTITREHIFDPFFTTKDVGKGTGLGLSMIFGGMQTHGGHVLARSEPGRGSEFQLYFPLVGEKVEKEQAAVSGTVHGQGQTILLADDQPMLLDVFRQALEALGYVVLTATDGEQALTIFESHQHEIDLILLDVVMPNKGGIEAAEEMRKFAPGLPVIFHTGYGEEARLEKVGNWPNCETVKKPSSIEKLSRLVTVLLAGK